MNVHTRIDWEHVAQCVHMIHEVNQQRRHEKVELVVIELVVDLLQLDSFLLTKLPRHFECRRQTDGLLRLQMAQYRLWILFFRVMYQVHLNARKHQPFGLGYAAAVLRVDA